MNTSDRYVVRKARFYSLSVPYTPKSTIIYSTSRRLFRTFIVLPSPLDCLSSEASVGITVPSMATISGLNEYRLLSATDSSTKLRFSLRNLIPGRPCMRRAGQKTVHLGDQVWRRKTVRQHASLSAASDSITTQIFKNLGTYDSKELG